MAWKSRVLPAPLVEGLSRLGDAVERGRVPVKLIDGIVAQLDQLPASAAPAADREIAECARLFRCYEQQPSLLHLFTPTRTHLQLLGMQPELALIFLFHRDGYVREASLVHLDGRPATSPFFVAAIAWRLNDWVRAVRIAARFHAQRALPATPPQVVANAATFLLDRWRRRGRWENDNMGVVDAALRREDVALCLAELFRTGAVGPLGSTLRYALRGPGLDSQLPELARSALQPSVRAVALKTLISGHASWPIGFEREWIDKRYNLSRRVTAYAHRAVDSPIAVEALIHIGLADRSAAVRRVSADGLIDHRATFAGLSDAIAKLAADRSPSLRERADYLIRSGP